MDIELYYHICSICHFSKFLKEDYENPSSVKKIVKSIEREIRDIKEIINGQVKN